jgi:hypothetical protein
MKSAAALLVGVALLAAAAPVCAQWRGQRPMMRHAPMVFPGGGPGGRPQRGPPPGPMGPPREGPQAYPAWRAEGGAWGPEGADPGWRAQQEQLRQGVRARQLVPLGQAIQSIRQHMDGRQLDANIEDWNGRTAYRVRWAAANGRRIDYIVDARTGEILSADAAP